MDYRQASRDLRRDAEDKLLALLQARTITVSEFLESIQRDLRIQATNPFVIEALSSFLAARADLGAGANAKLHDAYVTKNPFPIAQRGRFEPASDTSSSGVAHRHFHPQLRNFTERYGFRDMLLLDLDGNVVYSVKKRDDFASSLSEAPHQTGGLARVHREALANAISGNEAFVDFVPYDPGGGEPTGFIAVMMYDEGHRPAGVLAFEMPVDRINRLMQMGAGLGRTGETLIVGSDRLLRSASRLDSSSTILRQRISIDALSRAFAGESGLAISQEKRADGSEVAVLVAFQPIDFLGTRWVIAAKADLDEVYAPVRAMRDRAIVNGFGIAVLVALV
ncbi:MAG: cache domain-containing protein, partial [Stellaceae bacterium]